MLKNLFLSAALLFCCSDCKGQEQPLPRYSLVLTLEAGESVMVKTADGASSYFIECKDEELIEDFKCTHKALDWDAPQGLSIQSPQAYHIDYHLILWVQCPQCTVWYDAGHNANCPNQNCPSRIL